MNIIHLVKKTTLNTEKGTYCFRTLVEYMNVLIKKD